MNLSAHLNTFFSTAVIYHNLTLFNLPDSPFQVENLQQDFTSELLRAKVARYENELNLRLAAIV
jgi:hypothetical protein